MPLKVRVRKAGRSLAIMIPKAVVELHGFTPGDWLVMEPIWPGELRLRKIIDG